MRALVILAGLALVACSGPYQPTHTSGNYVSTEHGTARFADALEGARIYCAGKGMGVRHLGTDTPLGERSASRFECVPE